MTYKKKVPDDVIIESYNRLKSVWLVAEEVGLRGQTVHERTVRLGIQVPKNLFTKDDEFFLKEHYNEYIYKGKLQELADKMGRTKQFICRQAKKLGLTDIKRKKSIIEGYKKPTLTWKDKLQPKDSEKITKINTPYPRQKTTWKSGWREIGGKRKYFRSRWEANYARYLEFLKQNKQVLDWAHEPEVFWFEGIKRGCVSYLPDFKVTYIDNAVEYHEVKGWMDDRSKTKMKRMEKTNVLCRQTVALQELLAMMN